MTVSPPIQYDYLTPPRIVFGWGRRREVGRWARELGSRAWLVVGSRTLERLGHIAEISTALQAAGVTAQIIARIAHEPEVADVDQVVQHLWSAGAGPGDLVVAIGGGAALDLGKAASGLATNRASSTVQDYLEGVGRGLQLTVPPLPLLALPTTGGTGSEATKNAVISSYDPPFKKSLRSDQLVPRVVLVDPELTVSVPPHVTAHSGLDAITQLLESYITRKTQPFTQMLCVTGLRHALPALLPAVQDGSNRWAREQLAQAALLSGLALANSGLGLAHGVAAALGSVCRVPHGLACATLLPTALRYNLPVRTTELATLAIELGFANSGTNHEHAALALIEHIESLCRATQVPQRLSELGVQRAQLPALVTGSQGNSLSGNPRDISPAELHLLLERLL